MKRSTFCVCAVAAASLLAISDDAAAQQPTIEGVYTFDATASDDIKAAINTAVAKMNFIKRGIARGRLTKTNPAYQRIAIAREANEVVVTLDARKPIRMPADGSSIKWTREDGEKFDLKGELTDTKLAQTYVAEDGQRVNAFAMGADGNAMTLQVALTSSQLDKPMVYKLAYKRTAP